MRPIGSLRIGAPILSVAPSDRAPTLTHNGRIHLGGQVFHAKRAEEERAWNERLVVIGGAVNS